VEWECFEYTGSLAVIRPYCSIMTKASSASNNTMPMGLRSLSSWTVVIVLVLMLSSTPSIDSFSLAPSSVRTKRAAVAALGAGNPGSGGGNNKSSKSQSKKESRPVNTFTLADLRKQMKEDPAKFQNEANKKKRKGAKRSRKRVDRPQQQYLYASQRRALLETQATEGDSENSPSKGEKPLKKQKVKGDKKGGESKSTGARDRYTRDDDDMDDDSMDDEDLDSLPVAIEVDTMSPLAQAKEFGLMATAQHCDPLIDDSDAQQPVIVGQIRVGDSEESGSGSFAYLVEKPAGWSILGGTTKQKKGPAVPDSDPAEMDPAELEAKLRKKHTKRIKVEDEDGAIEVIEYSELDMLAWMTPEELEEYKEEQGGNVPSLSKKNKKASSDSPMNTDELDLDAADDEDASITASNSMDDNDDQELDPSTAANLVKIAARTAQSSETASFATPGRPSVVAWLKDLKAAEGNPIRGGKYWTALAGATGVDDSGLVLLCPKDKVDNIFVDYAEYVAVIGNGGSLAPRSKAKESALSKEAVSMNIVSKLRKGRGDDAVQTVRVTVPEVFSTCSSVVDPCQAQFQDGIRGDPGANPFDRRAPRRLIHCSSLSVSSLIVDESLRAETPGLPDDIAILADRRNHLEYVGSSFLGRTALKNNPSTNAYREINGDADGFPGWTVDRYDKWLLVSHDKMMPRGPLPSIHDGGTTGVYYLESNPDRSAMGSETDIRPKFLEGKPAPEMFPILENGVTYLVSLDKDLSTGIFLDQRPQRAWLTKNCNANTRVLNCFAHTGAFSVAAATAGASTVSLDLSKKWLDRLPEQLQSNGIEFDERHDCINGDCFDWLTRLAKRGEKYDIVILDPPSSSVGGRKKKRWSVKNDMDELVALASGLVKKGGMLWTTTNSASIHPIKFARLCRKGLEDAGIKSAKLERIQPMPVDFPSVGPQPVKNFVWRIL
jgi:23S rRNA (cytosine1962-C5)-methyltransferase